MAGSYGTRCGCCEEMFESRNLFFQYVCMYIYIYIYIYIHMCMPISWFIHLFIYFISFAHSARPGRKVEMFGWSQEGHHHRYFISCLKILMVRKQVVAFIAVIKPIASTHSSSYLVIKWVVDMLSKSQIQPIRRQECLCWRLPRQHKLSHGIIWFHCVL